MSLIYPFKGLRFEKNIVSKNVIAPPYDVIDKEYRLKLINSSEYNIAKIILPDSYDGAKEIVNLWIEKGVLKFDKECSYYIYCSDYEFDGHKKSVKGFLGALRLEEFGKSVKPHEKTLKGPKIDRFNLVTKTNAMFCPIMALYNEGEKVDEILEKTIENSAPIVSEEFESATHKIYKIRDKDDIETIHNYLSKKDVIIADGHHRYETALMIKDYYNKQGIESGGFDYIMTLFVDAHKGGLSLLPIHRLVKEIDDFDNFKNRLSEFFTIKESKEKCDFLMYHNGKFYSLLFKLARDKDMLKKLDVSIFEEYVYKKILSLSDDDIKNQKVAGYAHSEKEVLDAVDKKEAEIGFILNPISNKELTDIAYSGLTVPQKSTFFYPKIPSGLVAYHFDSIKGCNNV